MPVIICRGGNFSFQIKTQLAQLSLNSVEGVCFCGFEFFCVCARVVFVSVCMPTGKSNQRSCVVERLYKRSERGNKSGRQLRGQHVGVDGGLMQVPNSTSALGVLYSIHFSPLYFCMRLLGDVVNPPASIITLISRYICDSNQNNNTQRWIYSALYCKSVA